MTKIRLKLMLSFLVIALLSILFVAGPVLRRQIHEVGSYITQNALSNLSETSTKINSFLTEPARIVKDLEPLCAKEVIDHLEMENDLASIIEGNSSLYCLYYADAAPMDEGGTLYFSAHWNPDPDYDKFTREWYVAARLSKEPIITDPYVDADTKSLVTTIAYAVQKNNEFNGVVAIDILLKDLNEMIMNNRLSKSGVSYIIDRNGDYLTNSDFDKILNKNFFNEYPEFKSHKRDFSNEDFFDLNASKNSYLAATCINEQTGWIFVTIGHRMDFYGAIRRNMIVVLIVALISICVSIIIAIIISAKMVNPIKSVDKTINEIATGNADLTQRLEVNSKDEIGSLENGFNKFVEKLQHIISKIQISKSELSSVESDLSISVSEASSSIVQILSNIESVGGQIGNQVQAVEQTSAAVEEIAENINSLEKMIQKQADGVASASTAVEEMIGNIGSVNSSVERMSESFNQLQNSSKTGIEQQHFVDSQISNVASQSKSLQDANQAIANIASQTNLLAMNAAIEAAHAGDSGKGFAVVADEIRKLSETSSEQSKRISSELHSIVETINEVVKASAISTESLNHVSDLISDTDEIVRQINSAMVEQKEGSRQILDSLKVMNDSTVEVKNASAEMKAGNRMILSEMNNLQNTTRIIQDSIEEMGYGAKNMNKSSANLSDISSKVHDSIEKIGLEIDLFKA